MGVWQRMILKKNKGGLRLDVCELGISTKCMTIQFGKAKLDNRRKLYLECLINTYFKHPPGANACSVAKQYIKSSANHPSSHDNCLSHSVLWRLQTHRLLPNR